MMRRMICKQLVIAFALACGCTAVPNVGEPTGIIPDGLATPSVDSEVTRDDPQPGATIDDRCTRYIETVNGDTICLDELLAILFADNPRDNDGDGIPNINDDDIDGDGIPNGFDLDVDGDGLPNSTDDDIDDDGVPNAHDVDIDGDFLRNRWDPDMDADLLYNPSDRDADADGLEKIIIEFESECGPVELFNDPDVCTDDCDPSDDDDNDAKEDKCKDDGPEEEEVDPEATGQNVSIEDMDAPTSDPDDPTAREIALFGEGLESLFDDGDDMIDEFSEADPDATLSEVFDAVMRELEEAADGIDPDETGGLVQPLSEEALAILQERRGAVVALAMLADVELMEAVEVTDRFGAAVMNLAATLGSLVDTTRAIDNNIPGTSLLEDGERATALTEIAITADLPDEGIATAIAPTVQTARTVGDEDVLESVWRIVVDQVDAYRDDEDSVVFSLPKVALAVERVAGLLDDPTIDAVNESIANVLAATADRNLTDPLEVVNKLEELSATQSGFSVSDGISPDEAALAAEEADND